MRITMKQVAEKAGVHRSTVDKVIHDRPGVSEEVRQRVQAVIDQYGYRPNTVGVALRMQERTFRVAAVLMDVDSAPAVRAGVDQVREELGDYDIEVTYHLPADAAEMARILGELPDDTDGVILMAYASEAVAAQVDRLREAGIPTALVNSRLTGCRPLCYIGADDQRSGRLAAHLLSLAVGGTGPVALITSAAEAERSNASVTIREQAFRDALPPSVEIAAVVEDFESGDIAYQRTLALLRDRPDLKGIYCTCGGASRIGEAAAELGLDGRVAVITHESYPEILDQIRRGTILCTIGSGLRRQGERSMRTLMDRLLFQKDPASEEIYMRCEIVLRENADDVGP